MTVDARGRVDEALRYPGGVVGSLKKRLVESGQVVALARLGRDRIENERRFLVELWKRQMLEVVAWRVWC